MSDNFHQGKFSVADLIAESVSDDRVLKLSPETMTGYMELCREVAKRADEQSGVRGAGKWREFVGHTRDGKWKIQIQEPSETEHDKLARQWRNSGR